MEGLGTPSLGGLIRAEVITNVDPLGEGRIGVRIRKIMCDNLPAEKPNSPAKKEAISKSSVNNQDDNQYNTNIPMTNYLWARPARFLNSSPNEKTVMNEVKPVGKPGAGTHQNVSLGGQLKQTSYVAMTGTYDVPRVGSTVWVIFEDDDPQKLYYLPVGPSLTGQVTPMQNVEQLVNKSSKTKQVNITILREWHNGTVLYYDTNDDRNCFSLMFQNGHRMKFEFNSDASGIVLNTESGHIFELIDKSSAIGDDNELDNNDQDGISHGTFIKMQTAKGHRVLLDDNGGAEKIHVRTYSGHNFLMDDVSDEIHLWVRGGSKLDMIRGDEINLTTGMTIKLKSGGTVNVEAPTVNVTADTAANITTPELNCVGDSSLKIVSNSLVAINSPSVKVNCGVPNPEAPPSSAMAAAAPAMETGAAALMAAAGAIAALGAIMGELSSTMENLSDS